MPGFDWNGNGHHDAFDSFMDMKIINDAIGADSDGSTDFDDGEIDNDDFAGCCSSSGYVSHVSASAYNDAVDSKVSFQEQLKNSIRTPEAVRKENDDRRKTAAMYEAERTLRDIKYSLVHSAKDAQYTTQNGITTLSCFCEIASRYMRTRREDNTNQLKQNQQTFFLFRDSTLQYMTWNNYEIEPKYSNEYWEFITALKQLATAEHISIETVVYNGRDKKYVPFPSKTRNDYSMGWRLCVRATIQISNCVEEKKVNQEVSQTHINKHETDFTANQKTDVTKNDREKQDSNGIVIAKSLLAIGLCVAAFVICLAGDFGKLGMGILLIGAAIGGYHILK